MTDQSELEHFKDILNVYTNVVNYLIQHKAKFKPAKGGAAAHTAEGEKDDVSETYMTYEEANEIAERSKTGPGFAISLMKDGSKPRPKFVDFLRKYNLLSQGVLDDKKRLNQYFRVGGVPITLQIGAGYQFLMPAKTFINYGWVNINYIFDDSGVTALKCWIPKPQKFDLTNQRLNALVNRLAQDPNYKGLKQPVYEKRFAEFGLHDDAITPGLEALFNQFNALKVIAERNAREMADETNGIFGFARLKDKIDEAAIRPVQVKPEDAERTNRTAENLIFHGAPGTGKTFSVLRAAAELIAADNADESGETKELREILDKAEMSGGNDSSVDSITLFKVLQKNSRFEFVQFHPSYDYTDFVEGLRPVPVKADADSADSADSTVPTGSGFALQAGTFMEFCARARKDSGHQYYFLIDEINRGDISNIFGELFFLLDGGYRGVGVTTQYANLHTKAFSDKYLNEEGKFDIPDNVTIVGTMNDIDRSVDSFDFAMRRRFRFIDINWQSSIELRFEGDTTAYPQLNKVKNLMARMNNAIAGADYPTLNADYALGASYFASMAQAESDEKYDEEKAVTWDQKIKPLLEEYLRGNVDGKAIGDLQNEWNKKDDKSASDKK